MTSDRKIIETFGKSNLVYASLEKLHNIEISNEMKEIVLKTPLPLIISYFRFQMDFAPISEDIKVGKLAKDIGQLFTIGYRSGTRIVGTLIEFSEIGLNKSASLSDIENRIIILEDGKYDIEDEQYDIFKLEVTSSDRICINFGNCGEIMYIRPEKASITFVNTGFQTNNISIGFVNSSIQKLSDSLIAFYKSLSSAHNDTYLEEEIENFEKELKIIDPNALQNEANLWVEIIEAMRLDAEGY